MGKSEAFSKSTAPEVNRLIRVWGTDWGRYTCVGKFVPYSTKTGTPKRLRGKPRFCVRLGDGTFETDHDSWINAERWAYEESQPDTHRSKSDE